MFSNGQYIVFLQSRNRLRGFTFSFSEMEEYENEIYKS